ncbi:MAG TPA: AAA family ATPase [Xanthobacteraceae bacterium]|nr:AAA family ATPase [Xanthobacteraceae bacterium]
MRVLITGMSGTGKSAVTEELAARGHRAVDLDTSEWSAWIDIDSTDTLTPRKGKDWIWQEDKVRALLAGHDKGTLFVSGCAQNMVRLFPLIDMIVLLSAPAATIMKRLESRASDGYGNTEEERRKVRELIAVVEPLLRRSADYEIATTGPVGETADEILRACARHSVGLSR